MKLNIPFKTFCLEPIVIRTGIDLMSIVNFERDWVRCVLDEFILDEYQKIKNEFNLNIYECHVCSFVERDKTSLQEIMHFHKDCHQGLPVVAGMLICTWPTATIFKGFPEVPQGSLVLAPNVEHRASSMELPRLVARIRFTNNK